MNNGFLGGKHVNEMLHKGASLYFVGIGGVSMAGLAQIAAMQGFHVRGCDRDTNSITCSRLRLDNICIENEAAASPDSTDMIVYSAAVSDTSPAILSAKKAGVPCVSRADFLAAMMLPYKTRIAVAGMHGKSTTVGMLASILTDADLAPTVAGGAPLFPGGEAWRCGAGDVFLAEACEYRDSFLSLSPTLSVITNMELDHPDYFPTLADVERSFDTFISQSEAVLINGDCDALNTLASPECLRFGFSPACDIRGERTNDGIRVWYYDRLLGCISLHIRGDYNRQNALAAVAASLQLGIDFTVIRTALSHFQGIGRRMEHVGDLHVGDGTAAIYLDYAHHPTELTAAILAARDGGGRILCAFQPHTYTRTRALWNDFITALQLADLTVLIDIYAAREEPIIGTSSSTLAVEAGVAYAETMQDASAVLRAEARPGDTILILGAGDIDKMLPFLQDI